MGPEMPTLLWERPLSCPQPSRSWPRSLSAAPAPREAVVRPARASTARVRPAALVSFALRVLLLNIAVLLSVSERRPLRDKRRRPAPGSCVAGRGGGGSLGGRSAPSPVV